jgi:hypothetical protein
MSDGRGFRFDWRLSMMDVLTLISMALVFAVGYGKLDQRVQALERESPVLSQIPRIDERLTANTARDELLRQDIRSALDEIKGELREQRRLLEERRRDRP